MRIHRLLALGAVAVVLALFAACGSEEPTATPTSAPQAMADDPTPTPETMMEDAATPTPEAMMEDAATPTPGAMMAEPTATPTPRPTPTPVPPPAGFDAEDYFGGKTIKIITGASPGGGYDTFGRLRAAAAERYFPDSTRFIIQNLPGAGQLRGLRAVLDSKPDGYTIGPTHSRWFARQVLIGDIEGFDIDGIHILGSPTFTIGEDGFCLDRDFASSWQEVLDRDLTIRVGSAGPGNEPAIEFMIQNGAPFKMIYGYGGSSEIMAAFDRGEVDGTNRCSPGTAGRLYPEWIDQGRLVPIYYEKKTFNDEWLDNLGRTEPLPSFRDLPGLTFNPAQAEALELNLLVTEISRVFFLPPGVPDDVIQYWQSVFDQLMEDRQFRESVEIAGYADDFGYGRGEDILDIVNRVRNASDETRAIALELSGVEGLVVN
ncbi:MAG: hypothetical protein OXE50_00625 [Chloroflexi bacterium]|nr:hypothetical protein [Chloroflexota bacterium]